MSILDTANFWVEYVIRNGPNALRSPAIDLHWWQVELLDVYAFILLSTTIIITIIVVFVKKILQMVLRKFSNPQNSKKNQWIHKMSNSKIRKIKNFFYILVTTLLLNLERIIFFLFKFIILVINLLWIDLKLWKNISNIFRGIIFVSWS